jgi:hypothetical protein
MAYTKKVTEKVFNAVKAMLKGGATYAEISETVGIAPSTVYIIKKSASFEEYVGIQRRPNIVEAKSNEQNKQEVSNPTVVKVEATHYMMQELQKTNELLKGISAKLAFIVDELTGVKS